MIPYKPPSFAEKAFNCPHCGAYSHQLWYDASAERKLERGHETISLSTVKISTCSHCNNYSIWHHKKMVYPSEGNAPLPNPDLPENLKADYEEARSIVSASPRAAAALLRLVIQKICIELGEKGKDLNTDIGNLVKKGLPEKIQKALDSVRVIGNEAIHPGQMDLRDDASSVTQLFDLVNLIVDVMLTQPRKIEKIYGALPTAKKEAIRKRDGK